MTPKPVPGFPGLYLDTNGIPYQQIDGQIQRLKTSCTSTYSRVSFDGPAGRERHHVHILMAITFLGLDPRKTGRHSQDLQVDHIDGNKRNNALDNLQVITKQQNLEKAWRQGAYSRNGYASKGRAKRSLRKFKDSDLDLMIAMREQGSSYRQIAAFFGCDHKAIYRILRGETYQQR